MSLQTEVVYQDLSDQKESKDLAENEDRKEQRVNRVRKVLWDLQVSPQTTPGVKGVKGRRKNLYDTKNVAGFSKKKSFPKPTVIVATDEMTIFV